MCIKSVKYTENSIAAQKTIDFCVILSYAYYRKQKRFRKIEQLEKGL